MRIKGGERGYRMAIKDALYGEGMRMHSPSVRWAPDRGFFVCPCRMLVPLNKGELEVWVAAFSADTGRSTAPPYAMVRANIADALNSD